MDREICKCRYRYEVISIKQAEQETGGERGSRQRESERGEGNRDLNIQINCYKENTINEYIDR